MVVVQMIEQNKFLSPFEYNVIYIFRINDKQHNGSLKIGLTNIKTDKSFKVLTPFSRDLNEAAKKRIDRYTKTAAIDYELIYTEVAVYDSSEGIKSFKDYDVHF
jgi:hypothetical protein